MSCVKPTTIVALDSILRNSSKDRQEQDMLLHQLQLSILIATLTMPSDRL